MLVLVASDKGVNGGIEAERPGAFRYVVDLAVGQEHGACDTFARHVGQRIFERGEKLRAVFRPGIVPDAHDARFDVARRGDLLFEFRERGFRLGGALADLLALAFIDHDGGDIGHRGPVFLSDGRVQQRQHQEGECTRPPGRAARPPPEGKDQHDDGSDAQSGKQHGGQRRFENDIPVHDANPYCPSRSRRAGICT